MGYTKREKFYQCYEDRSVHPAHIMLQSITGVIAFGLSWHTIFTQTILESAARSIPPLLYLI